MEKYYDQCCFNFAFRPEHNDGFGTSGGYRYSLPDAFAEGHIPNAINIHDIFTFLATSSEQGIEELREKFAEIFGAVGLSGMEHAVMYEESINTGFGQSCRGYFLLKYLGYPKASALHGGYQAWLEVGLESSTDVLAQI